MAPSAERESPLKRRTREAVFATWSGELGLNPLELFSPNRGIRITINPTLPGIMVLHTGEDVRICASSAKIESMRDRFGDLSLSDPCAPAFWRTTFPELCGDISGPTNIYYIDEIPKTWNPLPTSHSLLLARGLAFSDRYLCMELAQALTPQEREASGFDTIGRQVWGVFAKGFLVAIAGYDAWPNRIAHIGVATHPQHRRNKYAQLATQAAIRGAIMSRRIAQYRCLAHNTPAAGIANALNLPRFAQTLFINEPA